MEIMELLEQDSSLNFSVFITIYMHFFMLCLDNSFPRHKNYISI